MSNEIPEWVSGLSAEDFQFIKRLLLASGSLKEVAKQYDISYPTVRIRLNRLIEKVHILDSKKPRTKFHKTVQIMAAEGRLDIGIAKELLKAFDKVLNEAKTGTKKIKTVRKEAIKLGFTKAYQEKRFQDILTVTERLKPSILEDNSEINNFVDIARLKMGDEF